MAQDLLDQLPEFWRARKVAAIAREVDAGQDDLGMAPLGERADLIDHHADRHRARIAAAERNDAERAAVVAAVLHLHEGARQAVPETIDEMRRHLLHRHDVADGHLLARVDVERRARFAPGTASHLVVVADDAIDLAHVAEHFRLRLRRAAGHDDAGIGLRALEPADGLPCLRDSFVGDGAGVDDDGPLESRAFRLARDHLGFERVEATAEGDDLDANATNENSEGSNFPSYSNDAVPVISTWSSRSRHSIASLPPGSAISTLRLARFSRAAATAVAQAAEPQALVNPAPRSQVRIVM